MMAQAFAGNPSVVALLGWTLLHFLWQGALIALVLAMALTALRTRPAQSRYLAACIALAAMFACPFITLAILKSSTGMANASPAILSALPSSGARSALFASTFGMTRGNLGHSLEPFLPWLVKGWLLGVVLLSVRLLGGWLTLQRFTRCASQPAAYWLRARSMELARQMGIGRTVRLRVSEQIDVPMVIGWLNAVILLPVSALSGLSQPQIEAILAHELAHIRRHDFLINLLQTALETLLFYHPAAWWVSRQIRIERENCCDDFAVSVLGDCVVYARALTALEELRAAPSALAMAANSGDLVMRIRRVLGVSPSGMVPFSRAGLVSALCCALAGVGAVWPSLASHRSGGLPVAPPAVHLAADVTSPAEIDVPDTPDIALADEDQPSAKHVDLSLPMVTLAQRNHATHLARNAEASSRHFAAHKPASTVVLINEPDSTMQIAGSELIGATKASAPQIRPAANSAVAHSATNTSINTNIHINGNADIQVKLGALGRKLTDPTLTSAARDGLIAEMTRLGQKSGLSELERVLPMAKAQMRGAQEEAKRSMQEAMKSVQEAIPTPPRRISWTPDHDQDNDD